MPSCPHFFGVVDVVPRLCMPLLGFVIVILTGCDQAKKVVEDVKSEVSGTPAPSVAPVQESPVVQTAPPVQTPAPPVLTPQEIADRFLKLSTGEITDGDLAQLASNPEAAALVRRVDLTGNRNVSKNGLTQLAPVEGIESLLLVSVEMLPDSLAAVGQLSFLKEISLAGTKADDSVVLAISSLPKLAVLDLSGTQITSASGAAFSRMGALQELNLTSTASDDQTVSGLLALPLTKLILTRTRISNASVAALLKMRTLETLHVAFTPVTGAAWKGYGKSDLKDLNVGETPFGLEGFDAIKGMRSLEILNVYSTGLVEHKAANVFKTFPNLRVLNAGSNSVTDAGMDVFFKGLKKIEDLRLGSNSMISDQGLAALVGTKTLRYLDVTNTRCTANGARALKAKLPDCEIFTNDGKF